MASALLERTDVLSPELRLRPAETVMTLARLGSFHATRLSFARVLLRRAGEKGWQFDRPIWRIDARGEGVAVYRLRTEKHVYSLVAFAHDLPADKRSDRVIANAWDATFVLCDGEPSEADLDRLARNVPLQEAGRLSAAELTLSRANRSVRLFDAVVSCLAEGRQPEARMLREVGYLMRTTAVYGNGKFGLADRETYADRPEFSGPFGAEMATVWLIRSFTVDLVEHLATVQDPARAVRLAPALRRHLGVGNSTGLGMAPFIVHHAGLLHRWILARETALARILALPAAEHETRTALASGLERAIADVGEWSVPDVLQSERNRMLAADLGRLRDWLRRDRLVGDHPWRGLLDRAEADCGHEAQEFVVSLILETHGVLVDDLADDMACDEAQERRIDGAQTLRDLGWTLKSRYDFALAEDFSRPEADALFWYVSEEKLEPRLGRRRDEAGAEREQPLAVARDAKRLAALLDGADPLEEVSTFLARRPEMRHVVRRVQLAGQRPFAEIRDNLIDAAMRPIDLLRCKLSFFGATRFDPKSDRWVRISLFADAPYPEETCCSFARPAEVAGRTKPTNPTHPRATAGTIVLSLNEIDAELRKAARGAGLCWGEAEEVGIAARRLASEGVDALATFADVLQAHLDGRFEPSEGSVPQGVAGLPPAATSPIRAGIRLLDEASRLARGDTVSFVRVEQPILILPFLADLGDRLGVVITAEVDGDALVFGGGPALAEIAARIAAASAARVAVTAGHARAAPHARMSVSFRGLATSLGVWDRLQTLSGRTYVPASEASRLTGAGSGSVGGEND